MKFHEEDRVLLETELACKVEEVTNERENQFLTNRQSLLSGYKEFSKQMITKMMWLKNRSKMQFAINRFNRSFKGKKAHRDGVKTLLTNIRPTAAEVLLPLGGIKTHLLIETRYTLPIDDQMEFNTLLDLALPMITAIETRVIETGKFALTEDEKIMIKELLGFDSREDACK